NTHVDTLTSSQLGSKDITETVPSGWTLTNTVCTGDTDRIIGRLSGGNFVNGGTTGFDAGDTIARGDVDAGETIECTFTNTKDATLRYTKVTDPAEDAQDFAFTASGTGVTNDTLDTDPASAGVLNTHVDTLTSS